MPQISSAPVPRREIFDLYWTFAARRQSVFQKRIERAPKPWTNDPILQQFKFCNVYRAADRVSQYLIRYVCYSHDDNKPEDRVFQIVAFRMFSNIATWEGLKKRLGGAPTLKTLRSGAMESALDELKVLNGGLYTGAFILCATKAFGFNEKHKNHVALFKHMFVERSAASRILHATSLKALVDELKTFPLLGEFMSYQIAIDINYSAYTEFNENDYTQAGPGALRGIKKAFTDLGSYSTSDIIMMMVERQGHEFERLGLAFRGLFGRPLHAIDCQGLFCELDKYCREAAPQLLSARTRIKSRFNESAKPLPLFFPPKWKLDADMVDAHKRVRDESSLFSE